MFKLHLTRLFLPLSLTALLPIALGLTTAQTPSPLSQAEKLKFYTTKVAPVLKANCLVCHSDPKEPSGGLLLTKRDAILKGGVTGPAVLLNNVDKSLLVEVIRYQGRMMPPSGKMPQASIDTLVEWVKMGLPMPGPKAGEAEPVHHGPPPVNAETKKFWSFLPIKRPAVPILAKTKTLKAQPKNPIDAFILAKLAKAKLSPAPLANKVALLRRATYDLTGLPPTPKEVASFLNDKSPTAYEKVVDRLLASPHYGEKWARHWMDLVRYAETNSFERDDPKPFAWKYRDYLIRSFNSDKPYSQFLTEQLAGDELPKPTPETIIATGYYRLGQWDDEPADPEQARYDELDDVVATTGQVFLGLTVNCARCHDHKIDPIPQKDYYRMVAIFQGTTRFGRPVDKNSLRVIAPAEDQKKYAAELAVYRGKLNELKEELSSVEKKAFTNFTPVEKEEFKGEMNRLPLIKKRVGTLVSAAEFETYETKTREQDTLKNAPPKGLETALSITESGKVPPASHIMLRGNPHSPGDEVTPGFPSVLSPPEPTIPVLSAETNSSGRRLALANWLVSPQNPLTARVMANRLWQYHFGRGIVRSSSNFGFMGNLPTHPELLDYLATELVRNNWKLKPLHRQIMLSEAYRRSSQTDTLALKKDPENDFMWRYDMRRLSAEEVRDSILAANGSLNPTLFGPSVYPKIEAEVLAGQSIPGYGWKTSLPEDQARRSVYVHIKRSLVLPILASFDAADADFTCPVRFVTTQPTQALSTLNSVFINEQARIFAKATAYDAGDDPDAQVKSVLWRVLQREPSQKEIVRGVDYLARTQKKFGVSKQESLRRFCLIALNLNEFVYLE